MSSQTMTPAISVVVPTRNRSSRLESLLESLRRQTIDDFEVIVVDDASTDETAQVLRREQARGGLALRVVERAAAAGPATARNAGWRLATAPLVAFTDDDCEAQPGWLEAALRAWSGDPARVIQGQVQPLAAERDRLGALSYSITVEARSPMFETANVFYPRALLERLGGFDETYPLPSGEDCDLGWRALALGAEQVFEPDALVHHAVIRLTPARMARRLWGWSHAMRPYALHPELRRHLHLGVFWNWSHYLLLRTLIALPLLRRRWGWPLAVWLAARYIRYEIEQSRAVTGSAWKAPVWVARDAIEMAACIRGAIRYRVLVL